MIYVNDGIELEVTDVMDKNGNLLKRRVWIDGMDLARAIRTMSVSYEANSIATVTIQFFLSSSATSKETV